MTLQLHLDSFRELARSLVGDHPLLLQLVEVLVQSRALLLHGSIHLRLREHGVVDLVVAVLAVADDVDHHVPLEAVAPLRGQTADLDDGVDVVAVDVEDGRLYALGDVGAVGRRARRARVSREADLVVDHDVDRASSRVIVQIGEAHRLEHDALPREGGVAVDQYRHRVRALGVARVVLLRAAFAFDNGVDGLEVRRVGHERDVHLLARGGGARVRHAQVVLDVARARKVIVGRRSAHARELAENVLHRLLDDVGENVQPAAVRHAEDDVLDSE
mmetsp:Transcript_57860/g.125613  ORF Transcript_57860/g.125613 Transcript_57860/m.125613 type:complete len:274 (-) Transcript_57860:871-1692(-)